MNRSRTFPQMLWPIGLAAGTTSAGLALGHWCGTAVDAGTGTGGRIVAGLGELASPWVLTAAIAGAVAAIGANLIDPEGGVSLVVGTVAGSWSLLIATLSYYNATGALTSPSDIASLPTYVRVWFIGAPMVGAAFGALGAIWMNDRTGRGGRWASVAISSTIAGEAFFALSNSWASNEQVTINLHRGLLVTALALGALMVPEGYRVRTVGVTLALSWPAAVLIARTFSFIY